MSEGTSKMILAGSLFAKQPSIPRKRVKLFKPLEPVTIGSLTVTAYPVDHSVYDAMAFVVEGGGKRLLYTGDLRSHGRKRGMGAQLLRAAKQAPIDALVIEGTRLGARSTEPNLSERDLEKQILADLRKAPGLALAMYSPLNLDRFVTFYKAALRSGRTFVIDPYQAFALHLINRKTLPQPSAKGHLRVLVPPRYPRSAAGRRLGHTNWAQSLGDGNITRQEILSEPGKYLLLYRISMQPWLIGAKPLQQTTYFFSYWPGYLEQPEMKQHMELLNEAGCSVLRRHASGHAHLEDLKSFPKLVPSKRLIPVHGFRPDLWMNFEPHVTLAEDGQPLFL
jgi:ribonuclease J